LSGMPIISVPIFPSVKFIAPSANGMCVTVGK
jgi:hypothetical protein